MRTFLLIISLVFLAIGALFAIQEDVHREIFFLTLSLFNYITYTNYNLKKLS